MLKNSAYGYGWMSILIHWLSAVAVFGMFALGWWMLTLTYYDEWYRLGPWWHKSIGILLLFLTLFRLAWKILNPTPILEGTAVEKLAAKLGHVLIYLLLFVIMISGYMISTADGSSISVFDWFEIPGYALGIERQEEIAGDIHWYAAVSLIVFAVGHAVMALKHHFINKDMTLKKMIFTHPKR